MKRLKEFIDKWLPVIWGACLVAIISGTLLTLLIIVIKWFLNTIGVMV